MHMNENFVYTVIDWQDNDSIDGFPKTRELYKTTDEKLANRIRKVLADNFVTPFGFEVQRETIDGINFKSDDFIIAWYNLFPDIKHK